MSNRPPERSGEGGGPRLVVLAVELGLLLAVMRSYAIESAALVELTTLAFAAFFVHHFLPARRRRPFFALLSIAGIGLVLGPLAAAWIVALGLSLIGLANLPIAFPARVALLLVAGLGLALARTGSVPAPWPDVIWPVLGSMFMFRMAVYVYDRRTGTADADPWWSLSYFFMLPNVCFPLFPVVDYAAFRRSADPSSDRFETYQAGVRWMGRGLAHLLLYRFVHQSVAIAPAAVDDAGSAARFVVATYLLYLYVSGSFHFIVGMLHLFGFALPETHRNFLLASSFTDFWRRINIYWKDFIEKLVFRPAYFRASRRFGATPALVLATVGAFLATWLLHSYQWFWIRGDFPVLWQDAAFWGILAVLVVAGALFEMRFGRRRNTASTRRTVASGAGLALRTAGTFVVVSLCWTVWNATGAGSLEVVADGFRHWTASAGAAVLAGLLALGAIAVVVRGGRRERIDLDVAGGGRAAPGFRRSATRVTLACVLALALAEWPAVLPRILADAVVRLQSDAVLGARDAELLQRGYYEDLTDTTRYNRELARIYAGKPADWEVNPSIRQTDGFPPYALEPSVSVEFKRARWSTNRWGMRDREYDRAKPEGVVRIAVLGASHTAGSGVDDGLAFESLTEERLNQRARDDDGPRYEILNFAVPGYGLLANLAILEDRVLDFEPDLVAYVSSNDYGSLVRDLGKEVATPFAGVQEILAAAGVDSRLPEAVLERRLREHRAEIVDWSYHEFVRRCRARGVVPIRVFLPRVVPFPPAEQAENTEQMRLAREAGFEVIDLVPAYESAEPHTLWLEVWDRHPNERAHELLAGALEGALLQHLSGVGASGRRPPGTNESVGAPGT